MNKKANKRWDAKKVIDWKYKLPNSKTLLFYKLVALRHEKIIKLFLKRLILKWSFLSKVAR